MLDRMDQLDRSTAENVLREMSTAGVDLDRLAAETGIHKTTLLRRLGEGSFKVRELGLIAAALNCPTTRLLAAGSGAVA